MKIRNEKMKLGVLAFAVQGALLAMCAMPAYAAEDDAAVDLKTPTNYIEIGAENVSRTSTKFGEYNGLDKSGGDVIGNFSVRGGDAYGSTTGIRRWEITGKDLGLTSRSLKGVMGDQGKWEIGIGYDELQHNTTTGFQTPYIGSNGGNFFMLPAGFGVRTFQSTTAVNTAALVTSTGKPMGTVIVQGDGNYVVPAGATAASVTAALLAANTIAASGVASNLANGTFGLTAAQQAQFHDLDVNNTRKNSSFNAKVFLNPELKLTFDYNRLKQGGSKLAGYGVDGSLHTAADPYTSVLGAVNAVNGTINATGAGEKASTVPMPFDYNTDTFNLGAHWASENANLSAAYTGSFFRDNYKTSSYQSFWIPATASYTVANGFSQGIDALTTPPDNDLHQLNLIGGYAFSKETKLTGGLSYGRNTQNAAFIDSELTYRGRPTLVQDPMLRGSANALVVTEHADLKLTNQTTKDLKLSAGVKYDQHNNRTASNIYDFSSNNFAGVSPANEAIYPNTPLSNRKEQLELAGDYRVNEAQNVRLAYNRENVKRWCDNFASNAAAAAAGYPAVTSAASLAAGGGGFTSVADAASLYPAGTNCVVATAQKEDKLSADYRAQVNADVSLRVGYAYSDRKTTSDPLARASFMTPVAMANGLNTNTIQGLNASDALGFYPVFDASRKQNLLKGALNWQAGDKLNVSLNGRYGEDKYGDSTYGVKKGDQWSFSLDAAYAYSDSGSITPYITQQRRTRDMTNFGGVQAAAVGVAATATANATAVLVGGGFPGGLWTWTNTLKDEDTTFGISAKQGDLMGGKLELSGDLTYSSAKTSYTTQYDAPNGLYCDDATLKNCGALPDVTNKMTSLKLAGVYKVDKSSKVALGYTYQKLDSIDYVYDSQQIGNTSNATLPSNQKSGSYSVNVVAVAYVYSFK